MNIDVISDALTIYDTVSNKYIYSNKAVETIFGYSLETIQKRGKQNFWLNHVVHPENKIKEKIYIVKKRWPKISTFRIFKPNGDIRWIERRSYSKSIINRKCIALVCRDITLKKEQDLIRELLELNLKSIPISVTLFTNKVNKCLFINKAHETIYGYPNENFMYDGYSFWKICVHPDDQHKITALPNKKNKASEGMFRIIRQDGEIKHIKVTRFHKLYKEDEYWIELTEDLTDKVKNNELYKLLMTVLNSLPYSFCIDDKKLRKTVFMSKYIETIYKQPISKLLKEADSQLKCLHPDDLEEQRQLRKLNKYPYKKTYRVIRPSGETRKIKEIHFQSENYVLGIEEDITDKINNEENKSNSDKSIILKTKIEIAKKLKLKGISSQVISETTGLSASKINNI